MDFIATISLAVGFPQRKSACDLQDNYSQACHQEDVSFKMNYFRILI